MYLSVNYQWLLWEVWIDDNAGIHQIKKNNINNHNFLNLRKCQLWHHRLGSVNDRLKIRYPKRFNWIIGSKNVDEKNIRTLQNRNRSSNVEKMKKKTYLFFFRFVFSKSISVVHYHFEDFCANQIFFLIFISCGWKNRFVWFNDLWNVFR